MEKRAVSVIFDILICLFELSPACWDMIDDENVDCKTGFLWCVYYW